MKQGPDVCAGFVSETPPTQSGERPGGRAGCAEERRAQSGLARKREKHRAASRNNPGRVASVLKMEAT